MQQEKPKQIYSIFLDISGSVDSSENYWNTVKDIFELYAKDIKNYYVWDHHVELVDKKKFQTYISQKIGYGGNTTNLIASECVEKNIKDVILITDGQIEDYDVQKCDSILENYRFNESICYIITSSSWGGDLNMSVTCPFTRNCSNKIYKKQLQTPMQLVVHFKPEDFQILQTLDTITLQNFQAEYEKIEGLVIALNMGKSGNIPLKNNLVLMKNRLIRQLAKQKGQKDLSDVIREYLQKNDFKSAIEELKINVQKYFKDALTTGLEKKIAHLIQLCGDLRGQYNLKQIKSNKMANAKNAISGNIDENVEMNQLSKNLIECPILNDDDVPQILIDECEPLLLGVEKCIVDDIAACPLRLLNYPDLKAKLKSRLSNYVGVMGIKANFHQNLKKNPFTQNRLLGGIPLGTHKSHIKVGNYTIAKLISGGKILGNMNLYYALIWYLIQEGSIEYLKDIEQNVTEHLIFRLKNTRTFASMCGKSQFVTTQLSTDIALWFCVNSGYLNLPIQKDTFRFHLYDLELMIKLVQTLGYPLDKGLKSHLFRTKSLFTLSHAYKSFTPNQKKSFQNCLKGLYQNGIFIDLGNVDRKFTQKQICPLFVLVDGPASEQQIKKIRQWFTKTFKYTQHLTNQELYYIANLANSQKTPSSQVLDYNVEIPHLPKCEESWNNQLKIEEENVQICPQTLKPLIQKKQNVENKDVFKSYKIFKAFVTNYKKLPTYDELLLFYYKKYVESGKYKVLPQDVQIRTKQVIESYKPVFQKTKTSKILKIWNNVQKNENSIETKYSQEK